MTDNGYVLAYRRSWSHPLFRDLLDAAIWNYLYQNAAWQDDRVFKLGTRVELKRGQIFVSTRELAVGFGCAEARVRRLINALSDDAMITTLPTHRGTIITICKYDQYQCIEETADARTDTRTARQRRTRDALYKDNETKETNERKERKKGVALPDWIGSDLWEAFREVRRGKKAAMTVRAEELILRELQRLKEQGHDPTAVVEQSIRSGWKDVYPVKPDWGIGHPAKPTKQQYSMTEI